MISEVLKSIDGIAIYPTISLVLFFIVFAVMAVRTFRLDKGYRDRMKNLPFEDNDDSKINGVGENG